MQIARELFFRMGIFFEKPKVLDLENRKWKALNCASIFIFVDTLIEVLYQLSYSPVVEISIAFLK